MMGGTNASCTLHEARAQIVDDDRAKVRLHRHEDVMREAELPSLRQARWMTLAVFAALKEQISSGEARDVMSQLPKDLRELWAEAQSEV